MEEKKNKYDDNRYEYDNGFYDQGRYDYEDSQYDKSQNTYDSHSFEQDSYGYDEGFCGYGEESRGYDEASYDYDRKSRRYYHNNNIMDNLGEWMQDIVQSAVDNMDFEGLNENIHNALERAKNEMTRQMQGAQKGGTRRASQTDTSPMSGGRYHAENGRYRTGYEKQARDSRERKPVVQRQPKGWLKKIPGRWSGPAGTLVGAGGCLVFGFLSLLFALGAIGMGAWLTGLILECIFVPLTIACGVLFARSRNAGKRVKRIQMYARQWGEQSFVMLEDLAARTGYSLKIIQKDIHFILDRHLLPEARLDQNQTCLMLTEEAGRQYDEAMRSRMERERTEREKAMEQERTRQEKEREQEEQSRLSEEERRMHDLMKKAESSLQEIRVRKDRIQTVEVQEKIGRLEVLLSRVFVCVKEYPENVSRVDRLMEYYLPSVMKLIRVYEDMEKQPIQTDNIRKTRSEIESSLDTVYHGLEAMYDDLFQDVAMDISSDIRVLEAMLAKDGWGGQALHSSERKDSIFGEY